MACFFLSERGFSLSALMLVWRCKQCSINLPMDGPRIRDKYLVLLYPPK